MELAGTQAYSHNGQTEWRSRSLAIKLDSWRWKGHKPATKMMQRVQTQRASTNRAYEAFWVLPFMHSVDLQDFRL